MQIKSFELTNTEGKRNTAVCNAIRKQMIDKLMSVLADADFEVTKAANGDLAILTAEDATTGNAYYTRLAVSFSDKDLDSKIAKKPREKAVVELPVLFDDED